jgi:azurin
MKKSTILCLSAALLASGANAAKVCVAEQKVRGTMSRNMTTQTWAAGQNCITANVDVATTDKDPKTTCGSDNYIWGEAKNSDSVNQGSIDTGDGTGTICFCRMNGHKINGVVSETLGYWVSVPNGSPGYCAGACAHHYTYTADIRHRILLPKY